MDGCPSREINNNGADTLTLALAIFNLIPFDRTPWRGTLARFSSVRPSSPGAATAARLRPFDLFPAAPGRPLTDRRTYITKSSVQEAKKLYTHT